jgi:hypothetical protein
MGPYCKFCNQRCFTHMPDTTPPHILKAYRDGMGGGIPIIATCPSGMQFERDKFGYCYQDICHHEIRQQLAAEARALN